VTKKALAPLALLASGVLIAASACAPALPRPAVRRPAPPPAAPAPQPVPPPAPEKEPPAPRQPEPAPVPAAPLLLKVGLASDLDSVTLPCCEEGLAAVAGNAGNVGDGVDEADVSVPVTSTIKVEPAAASAQQGYYRLQVAALRDERQAGELAQRLQDATGQPGDAHFDVTIDLYRVRVGRYSTREEAELDLHRMASIGVIGAFVVNEGGGVSAPALRVTQGGASAVYPGRWLAVSPATADSVRVQGKRYRGRILVFLNDRGTLNLINEVPIEEYLRGVVPSEMGPEKYNQLEALKAQAVAARTYTLRNLGEFSREGYDICATPRCQVYGGVTVEHPLSDRAVAETAGQVLLYQGELADTLYSSTCGGHTEDVGVIFPLKHEPYLKGVPCMEMGFARVAGTLPAGTGFPEGLTREVLPPAPGASPVESLSARIEHLALLAGLPVPREHLVSLDRREVQRFIANVFDLVLDARLFLAPQDVEYLLHDPPPDWTEEDRRRAAYLIRSGLMTGPLDHPLDGKEVEQMLLSLAEMLRVVRREEVSFLSLDDGKLIVKSGKEQQVYAMPEKVATFRLRGTSMTSAPLAMVAGDRLTLFWQGDRLLALMQEVDLDGVAFDRSSPYSSWTRFRTDSQLAAQVRQRFPGLGFQTFEILSRGGSGRVGKIRITGDGGQTMDVEGLAVRWTLDVPDTLFTAKRLAPKNQEAGWLFTGRGFGHGVGMCQVGAYGMAQRGHDYREILTHYYSGVELGRLRWTAADAAAAAGKR
jgi:peptidoglycan hydrolase-like amidase